MAVVRPSVEPIPARSEDEVIAELKHAQMLRRKHYTEQQRIFASMTDLQYRIFSRRLEQLIAIEDAGIRRCNCTKCAGNCPGKFPGSSSQLVCYDCSFGKHRGLSVDRESPKGGHDEKQVKPAATIKRKSVLKIKRRR